MPKRHFIVLKYEGKAGCEMCKLKFFTPVDYSRDVIGACEYLFNKFDHHSCEPAPKP
jgi:hypothetical protein